MTSVYALRINEEEALNNSSSGGAFTAISDFFIDNGNAVICVIYDYDLKKSVFKIVTNKSERDFARGSKYMGSYLQDIFLKASDWIEQNPGKTIAFFGMGCQVDGFRAFSEAKGFRDRVLLVDIICHGMTSPMIWKAYSEYVENKYNGVIKDVYFKNKRNGWSKPYAGININGEDIAIDDYVNLFFSHCINRPACHKCRYCKVQRKTDITIGDFWNIENVLPQFYSEKGNSLVLIHSESGKKVFNRICDNVVVAESNVVDCLQPNLVRPTPVSVERESFWKCYNNKGIVPTLKKYGKNDLSSKIRRKILNIFYKNKKISY